MRHARPHMPLAESQEEGVEGSSCAIGALLTGHKSSQVTCRSRCPVYGATAGLASETSHSGNPSICSLVQPRCEAAGVNSEPVTVHGADDKPSIELTGDADAKIVIRRCELPCRMEPDW